MDVLETVTMLQNLVNVPFVLLQGTSKSRVIYISSEGGTFAIWCADPKTGSRLRLSKEPAAEVATPRTTSDSITYTVDAGKGAELHKVFKVDARTGESSLACDPPPMRIEGIATSGDTVAFTGATKEDLAVYSSGSAGLEKRAVLPGIAGLTDASPDYLVGYGVLAKNPRSSELFVFDLGTGRLTDYTPKAGSVNKSPRVAGTRILFESDATGWNRLHVYDVATKELSPASFSHDDWRAYNAVEHLSWGWTPEGKVWFVGARGGEAKAFLDGKELPTPHGYIWGMGVLNGKAYLAHTNVTQPMQIMELDTATSSSRTIVDNPLPPGFHEKLKGNRFVTYKSFDGRDISALVVDDGSGKPKRTVVYVHGGPWANVVNTWGIFLNSMALSGYNIVAPNYRGSLGYGEEFRILDIGDPGGGDMKDIEAAADWAVKNGVATEVAIAGFSYGGYAALLEMGRDPDRWACGVAGAPIADWKAMYEMSDAAYRGFADVLFGNKLDLMPERSPQTYVKGVRKPLCMIASQNDTRTPLKPVLRYAQDLAEQGISFEFHSVPDAGHTIRDIQDAMNNLYPALAFLHKQFPA